MIQWPALFKAFGAFFIAMTLIVLGVMNPDIMWIVIGVAFSIGVIFSLYHEFKK